MFLSILFICGCQNSSSNEPVGYFVEDGFYSGVLESKSRLIVMEVRHVKKELTFFYTGKFPARYAYGVDGETLKLETVFGDERNNHMVCEIFPRGKSSFGLEMDGETVIFRGISMLKADELRIENKMHNIPMKYLLEEQ